MKTVKELLQIVTSRKVDDKISPVVLFSAQYHTRYRERFARCGRLEAQYP